MWHVNVTRMRVKPIVVGTVCNQCKNSLEVYQHCSYFFTESPGPKPPKILVCQKFPVKRKTVTKTDWVMGEEWQEDITDYPYFFKECVLVNLSGNCPLYLPK